MTSKFITLKDGREAYLEIGSESIWYYETKNDKENSVVEVYVKYIDEDDHITLKDSFKFFMRVDKRLSRTCLRNDIDSILRNRKYN